MSKDNSLKQEQLENVSGGDSPLNITKDPVGKKRYVVNYRKSNIPGPDGKPEYLSHDLGWHLSDLAAENAGRYFCKINNYHFINVRVVEHAPTNTK